LYTTAARDEVARGTASARIVVRGLGTDEVTALLEGVDGRYLATGHLLYRSGASMLVVRFDPRRLTVAGAPVAIADAAVASGAVPFATHLAVSATGTLVYLEGSGSAGQDLAVLDRHGRIERRLGLPDLPYATPRVSPDGNQVAYSERTSDPNIWIVYLDGAGAPRRLTFEGRNRFPVWSADGRALAFQSDREGGQAIFLQRIDGDGAAERLTTPEAGTSHAPEAFSPDGQHLLVRVTSGDTHSLWLWARRDRSLTRVQGVESQRAPNATFSPDGRFIAYTVVDRDRSVSFVRPFPLTAAQYQVPLPEQSANLTIHPVWSAKAPELIYSAGPGLLATAPITIRSTVEFGTPTVVQIPGTGDPLIRSWDVTPDGQHVIRVIETNVDGTRAPPINVVVNWFEELKARVPVP
jgi:Tol biopolymer transport system component